MKNQLGKHLDRRQVIVNLVMNDLWKIELEKSKCKLFDFDCNYMVLLHLIQNIRVLEELQLDSPPPVAFVAADTVYQD